MGRALADFHNVERQRGQRFGHSLTCSKTHKNRRFAAYCARENRYYRTLDDPYRSLAGALRRLGGYAKDTTPFSEFLWADFLRRRIDRKEIEDHLKRAVNKALELAKSRDADYLPGWCGLVDD